MVPYTDVAREARQRRENTRAYQPDFVTMASLAITAAIVALILTISLRGVAL